MSTGKWVPQEKVTDELIRHVLTGVDDCNVVVGPLANRDGTHYFIVAASEHGFRCDQIIVDSNSGDKDRAAFLAGLSKTKGFVVHDLDCELRMAKLCEVLWPGPRVSTLRKAVEAEQAAEAVKQAHNKFYQNYTKHLPAVPLDAPFERGKLYHTVIAHDDWCAFYSGAECNCDPAVTRHVEPERS